MFLMSLEKKPMAFILVVGACCSLELGTGGDLCLFLSVWREQLDDARNTTLPGTFTGNISSRPMGK
jgi:hypothetical protein